MSVAESNESKPAIPFRDGDRLTQPEFHRLYEQTPPDFRAELVNGIVYFSGRRGYTAGGVASVLCALLGSYSVEIPGVTPCLGATVILNELNEVEPDLHLRIDTSLGGQTSPYGQYLQGAPELVVEIADSSRPLERILKRDVYQSVGVKEYIAYSCNPASVHVFDFVRETEIEDVCCTFRSSVFGGLWLDFGAIVSEDNRRALKVVQQGLASPEHAEFVKRLTAKD